MPVFSAAALSPAVLSPTTLPASVQAPASLTALRSAVADLAAKGAQEVTAVRSAFISGLAPLQTVSSGSKADFITRFGGATVVGSAIAVSTAQFGLTTSVVVAPPPPPRPELDFVQVGVDRARGVLDSFFARVVFSVLLSDLPRVSYFRVMRASTGPVSAPKPSFSALADSIPLSSRTKSTEVISNQALRVAGVGVTNKLSDFVADDHFANQRNVLSNPTLRPLPAPVNTNRRGSPASLVSVANADRSVLENVGFYVNRRSMSPGEEVSLPLQAAQRQGLNVLRGRSVGSSTAIVASGNSMGFSEVARVSAVPARKVGDVAEFEFHDPSVVYGGGYVYYVVAVVSSGVSGTRSRLVIVEVTRSTPPLSPDVLYGVSSVPRFVIRTSGSFVDHFELFRRGGDPPRQVGLVSTDRSMIDRGIPTVLDSGFYHIGDVGAGPDRSAIFVDRGAPLGVSLDYRVYTVDSFGLKSQTPFSCSVLLPDPGRVIPLGVPSITAEQMPGGHSVNVIVACDDRRVTSFVIGRRDLGIGENGFRQPTFPDYFRVGSVDPKRARSRSGPSLNQFSSKAWNGIVSAISGVGSFVDRVVEFDRTYQYSVVGIDIRGNETATVPAQPVFVSVKPVSDAPVALTGTVVTDDLGSPTGVLLSWKPGTLDFSPSELIDDQDVLAATAQRSLFQVERRQVGKSVWQSMPATTSSYFVDPVGTVEVPLFRPSLATPNLEYEYRVIAMQSGAFVSPHTPPVRVSIVPGISPPSVLFVRASSTAVRPLRVVVSWDYQGIFVDGWEVQRAVTNRVFGSKVPSMDSAVARSLEYVGVARVTRESSRALGISADPSFIDRRAFVGNRGFLDVDVSMANSYFYRVRSFDSSGHLSDWVYGGIALTDSPFDRKFLSALSDAERAALAADPRPLRGWEDE